MVAIAVVVIPSVSFVPAFAVGWGMGKVARASHPPVLLSRLPTYLPSEQVFCNMTPSKLHVSCARRVFSCKSDVTPSYP
ncbi:hypothetical protein F5Y10DRAFT_237993 [Nemania abortiva]|nr:hypothetical protein F5Y10DRAFT_237993 [Nemania abortiva]